MRRISCSDPGIQVACEHLLEAQRATTSCSTRPRRTREEHAVEDFDREAARALIKPAD